MSSILALGVAPAVVSSGVLMRIKPLVLPTFAEVAEVTAGEFGPMTPVNFVLMRELLNAARKKLPYFSGASMPGAVNLRLDRVGFEVSMR